MGSMCNLAVMSLYIDIIKLTYLLILSCILLYRYRTIQTAVFLTPTYLAGSHCQTVGLPSSSGELKRSESGRWAEETRQSDKGARSDKRVMAMNPRLRTWRCRRCRSSRANGPADKADRLQPRTSRQECYQSTIVPLWLHNRYNMTFIERRCVLK